MKYCPGLTPKRSKFYKPFWNSVFVVMLLMVTAAFYFATKQVDYTWRWNRVPQYFAYNATIEITSETEGEVVNINKKGKEVVITVESQDSRQDYTMPLGALKVESGRYVYEADILGSYSKWQVGILLKGLWLTLFISVIAIGIGIILGLFTGLCRISDNPALHHSAIVYIELVRGSPLLVQIFLWYFVFGKFLNDMLLLLKWPMIPTIWYGIISLAIFVGAYVAEIVRAGIQSIQPGQMEAARSLGMSAAKAMRLVILPQAFKRILPPLAGQFISLIKDSSLLGIVAIRELTKVTREIVSGSLMPFELWFVCALLYLILTFSLSLVVQWLERRTQTA